MRSKVYESLLWFFLLLVISSCTSDQEIDDPILAKYMDPYPVSLSPGGRYIVDKKRGSDSFELFLREIISDGLICAEGKLISQANYTQLSLSWNFKESILLWVQYESMANGYVMKKYSVGDGNVNTVPFSVSTTAISDIKWSVNSKKFAFLRCNIGNCDICVYDSTMLLLAKYEWNFDFFSKFTWIDSCRLALSQNPQSGDLVFIDLCRSSIEVKTIFETHRIKDIDIDPDGFLYLIVDDDEEFDQLYKLDTNYSYLSDTLLDCNAEDLFVDNGILTWQENRMGHLLLRSTGIKNKNLNTLSENFHLKPVGEHKGNIFLQALDFSGFVGFLSLNLNNSETPQLICPNERESFIEKPPSFIYTRSDTDTIQSLVWSPKEWNGKTIMFIHGGPAMQMQPYWSLFRSLALDYGYNLIEPNYSGSTGYTSSFQNTTSLEVQVKDIISVINQFSEMSDRQPKDIILMGSSYGCQIAVNVASLVPDLHSIILLSGVFPYADQTSMRMPNSLGTKVFYGDHDPLLNQSLDILKSFQIIGDKNSDLLIFKDEGHAFHKLSTWQRIFDDVAKI